MKHEFYYIMWTICCATQKSNTMFDMARIPILKPVLPSPKSWAFSLWISWSYPHKGVRSQAAFCCWQQGLYKYEKRKRERGTYLRLHITCKNNHTNQEIVPVINGISERYYIYYQIT